MGPKFNSQAPVLTSLATRSFQEFPPAFSDKIFLSVFKLYKINLVKKIVKEKWPFYLTTIGYRLHDFDILLTTIDYKLHNVATL